MREIIIICVVFVCRCIGGGGVLMGVLRFGCFFGVCLIVGVVMVIVFVFVVLFILF